MLPAGNTGGFRISHACYIKFFLITYDPQALLKPQYPCHPDAWRDPDA